MDPVEDSMSASGISESNPVMPASWSPAPQDSAAPPAQPQSDPADSTPSDPAPAPQPPRDHKVDVRA